MAAYEAAFTMTVPPAGNCGQPRPADGADRHQLLQSEHAGDYGHQGPVHENVGPGRRGDVWLCRRLPVKAVAAGRARRPIDCFASGLGRNRLPQTSFILMLSQFDDPPR